MTRDMTVVHQLGGEPPEDGVLAVLPPAPHGIVALIQLGHQPGNLLGGVLQVRVQGDHHLAPGRLKPGKNGLVLPEIAVELQGPDVLRILPVQVGQELPGAVGGAVVHEDNFIGAAHGGEGADQPLPQFPEIVFLVEHGNDHGNLRGRRGLAQGENLVGHGSLPFMPTEELGKKTNSLSHRRPGTAAPPL